MEDSLVKAVKNTGLILAGTIISIGISILRKILILNYLTVEQNGFYTITLGFLDILPSLCLFGTGTAIVRQISYNQGKNKYETTNRVITTGIIFALLSSIIITIIFIFVADYFLLLLHGNLNYIIEFRLFIASIPLTTLLGTFISINRGFNKTNVKIIFEDLLKNVVFTSLILLLIFILPKANSESLFLFSIIAFVSTLLPPVLAIFYSKKIFNSFKGIKSKHSFNIKILKELLKLALPYFFAEFFLRFLNYTDVFFLGYYLDPNLVGLYGAAKTISRYIPLISLAFVFIFVPFFSKLLGTNAYNQLNRKYKLVAKWIYLVSFPFFLIIFSFPNETILFLAKADYLPSARFLQILCISSLVLSLSSINTIGVVSTGKTKLFIIPYTISIIVSVFLNIIMIPHLGLYGAAFAFLISILTRDSILFLRFYKNTNLHPFSKNLIKIIAISIFGTIYLFFTNTILIDAFILRLANGFIAAILILTGFIFFRCFEIIDLEFINLFEIKFGINLSKIKKLLQKFIKED